MSHWERQIRKSIGAHSESEVETKKEWIDGKPIYRKVIDMGALPNNTTKSVAHNISSFDNMLSIRGFADDGTTRVNLPHASDATNTIVASANASNAVVTTYTNLTAYSGYLVLEYTK